MRRTVGAMLCLALFFAGGRQAPAADGTGIDAGIKLWLNGWHQSRTDAASISSDTIMLLGPAVEARPSTQVFLEASFLFSTSDYRFSEPGLTANISRQDIDLAAGYLVVPGFGLFAGYKRAVFDESATGIRDTVAGPTLGMAVQAPMGPWLSFYGRLLYLFTRFEQDAGGVLFTEDSPGWGLELGLKYEFTEQFLGSIGYRYETNQGKESDVRDSFGGLTLAAMIRF